MFRLAAGLTLPSARVAAPRRTVDIRAIDGPLTPTDRIFTTQHYGHPKVDVATYALRISGLVDRPISLSLDEIRKLPRTELVFGFESPGAGRSRASPYAAQIRRSED
jgi:DMSO/TMAO reductase YedYZ molybdopterin-dependent catalytic subunit